MKIAFSILIGYLLGCINPAALIARLKNKNLRGQGTRNLGATNVSMVIGKRWGIAVMLFDIAKAFAAYRLAAWLFPELTVAGLIAGCAAVAGHIFPFYLKWKGGKGLAAFAGLVLAHSPWLFLLLLTVGVALMFLVNYTFILPYSAGVLFCVLSTVCSKSLAVCAITAIAGGLLMWKHRDNLIKAIHRTDKRVRESLFKKKDGQRRDES